MTTLTYDYYTPEPTFQVWIWTTNGRPDKVDHWGPNTIYKYPDYKNELYWEGNSFLLALVYFCMAKYYHPEYVKLEWR